MRARGELRHWNQLWFLRQVLAGKKVSRGRQFVLFDWWHGLSDQSVEKDFSEVGERKIGTISAGKRCT